MKLPDRLKPACIILGCWAFASSPAMAQDTERITELDDITVTTGTRTTHKLSEAPVRTELIQAEDLELRGTRDLADAMELVPGVRVENNCQNCGTSDILLLGLEGKYTTVLFDGLPLYSGLAGVYGINQIPTLFLDRIEVVKGAASAAYGSGAVGGIVNLIGRNPVTSGGEVQLRYDSVKGEPGYEGSFVIDHVSENGRTRLSAYGLERHQDPVDLSGDGLTDLVEHDLSVIGFRLYQTVGEGEIRLDLNVTNEGRAGGNKLDLPENLADVAERIYTDRVGGQLVWDTPLTDTLFMRLAGGFAYIDRDSYYGGLFGADPRDPVEDPELEARGYRTAGEVAQDNFGYTENLVWHVESQLDRSRDNGVTSFGIQYDYESIEDLIPVSPFVEGYPVQADEADGSNLGIFLQDDWSLNDQVNVVLGIRADKNSELDDPIFSPRLAIRYQLNEELILRATAGTGFRAPDPFDEDLHIEVISGARATTRQADDLEEEKSYSGLISAIYSPSAFNGNLTLEVNGFYTALRDTFTISEIQEDPNTGEAFRERFNGPDAEVGGVEVNVGMMPTETLRIDLGLVSQFARFDEPVTIFENEDGTTIEEDDFLESPELYGVAQATWQLDPLTEIALGITYTGSMKKLNEASGFYNQETDTFLVFDLVSTRTFEFEGFPNLTLSLGVKNLTDDRQDDLDTGFDRDVTYFYGPRTPRTVFASFSAKF